MNEKNPSILEKCYCLYEKADKDYKHEDVKKEDEQLGRRKVNRRESR